MESIQVPTPYHKRWHLSKCIVLGGSPQRMIPPFRELYVGGSVPPHKAEFLRKAKTWCYTHRALQCIAVWPVTLVSLPQRFSTRLLWSGDLRQSTGVKFISAAGRFFLPFFGSLGDPKNGKNSVALYSWTEGLGRILPYVTSAGHSVALTLRRTRVSFSILTPMVSVVSTAFEPAASRNGCCW